MFLGVQVGKLAACDMDETRVSDLLIAVMYEQQSLDYCRGRGRPIYTETPTKAFRPQMLFRRCCWSCVEIEWMAKQSMTRGSQNNDQDKLAYILKLTRYHSVRRTLF